MKHLLFSLLLIVLAVGIVNAQVNDATAVAAVSVTVVGGIELVPGAFGLEGLSRGSSYHVFYSQADGAFMYIDMFQAQDAAVAPAAWDPFDATALNPGASVTISFPYLPSKLLSEQGSIDVSYPKVWAGMDITDAANVYPFNPNVPFTFTTGFATENLQFAPEMIITVPKGAVGETFLGIIVANIAYTGL